MAIDSPSRSNLSAAWADQLRAERAAKRLSRAELAKKSGVSAKSIQRFEENERVMDTNQLDFLCTALGVRVTDRSEEHTSELQSLMRISYAVFCLKKKNKKTKTTTHQS